MPESSRPPRLTVIQDPVLPPLPDVEIALHASEDAGEPVTSLTRYLESNLPELPGVVA